MQLGLDPLPPIVGLVDWYQRLAVLPPSDRATVPTVVALSFPICWKRHPYLLQCFGMRVTLSLGSSVCLPQLLHLPAKFLKLTLTQRACLCILCNLGLGVVQ